MISIQFSLYPLHSSLFPVSRSLWWHFSKILMCHRLYCVFTYIYSPLMESHPFCTTLDLQLSFCRPLCYNSRTHNPLQLCLHTTSALLAGVHFYFMVSSFKCEVKSSWHELIPNPSIFWHFPFPCDILLLLIIIIIIIILFINFFVSWVYYRGTFCVLFYIGFVRLVIETYSNLSCFIFQAFVEMLCSRWLQITTTEPCRVSVILTVRSALSVKSLEDSVSVNQM